MIEIEVRADSTTRKGVREALVGLGLANVSVHLVPDAIDSGRAVLAAGATDRRSSFPFGDLSHLYIALSVPATYVLKKLLDPTLEGLGKAIFEMLRRGCQAIQNRTRKRTRPVHLIFEFGQFRYILVSLPNSPLTPTDISAALACACQHFAASQGQTAATEGLPVVAFELMKRDWGWEVAIFDPLP